MTNVLVGGGTGLLGSALVSRLVKADCKVFVPTRQVAKLKECRNQEDPQRQITYLDAHSDWHEQVADLEFQKIFHLAASNKPLHSFADVEAIVDANITQGLKLALIASKQKIRTPLIYAQTFWQYSDGKKEPAPNSVYAALKQGFQQIARFYCDKLKTPTIGLVIFDTYSEEDRRSKLLPQLAKLIADKKRMEAVNPLRLTSGSQQVCFIHVEDIVDAFMLAANYASEVNLSSQELTFFLSGGKPISLKELIKILLSDYDDVNELVQWDVKSHRPEDVFVLPDGPNLPGWQPQRCLKKTFQKMVLGFENE